MSCHTLTVLTLLMAHWTSGGIFREDERGADFIQDDKEYLKLVLHEMRIKSKLVKDVLMQVDRTFYVHKYASESTELKSSDRTPNMVAFILEALENHLKEGNRALDVDCSGGYLTACMGVMVGRNGCAVGTTESKIELNLAIGNVMQENPVLLASERVQFQMCDLNYRVPKQAPFDAIYVEEPTPKEAKILIDNLKIGGRMLLPIRYSGMRPKMLAYDKKLDGTVTEILVR